MSEYQTNVAADIIYGAKNAFNNRKRDIYSESMLQWKQKMLMCFLLLLLLFCFHVVFGKSDNAANMLSW